MTFSPDTTVGALEAAAAAFALTWLVTFVAKFFGAPSSLFYAEKTRADGAEARIAALLDEYAHTLELTQVDQEDRRRLELGTTNVIARQMRLMLRLRNTGSRPLRYEVMSLQVNETTQINPATRGSVIPAGGSTTYYSHWVELPIDNLEGIYAARMNLEMQYGHPDRPATRIIQKSAELELLPANQGLHLLYLTNIDDPVEPRSSSEASQGAGCLAHGLFVSGVTLVTDVLSGKKRNVQLGVRVENSTQHLMRYIVDAMFVSLNGKTVADPSFANSGGILRPGRPENFQYPTFRNVTLPKEANAIVSINISYGPVDVPPVRHLRRGFDCTVRVFNKPATVAWISTDDEDEAI